MIRRFGIDTSVLVRLVTGQPEESFAHVVRRLSEMALDEGTAVVASNQVIGEAYIAIRHHYGVTKAAARSALIEVLRTGLVAPLNGLPVLDIIETSGGAGLLDRLTLDDYQRRGMGILALDKAMAGLPGARIL